MVGAMPGIVNGAAQRNDAANGAREVAADGDRNDSADAARKDADDVAASTPIAISAGVQAPILVHRVLPRVPRTVSAGRVVLEVIVGERGDVRVTRVAEATPGLERSVVEAVEQWRYQPARLRGRDQAVRMTVVVTHPPAE